MPFYMAPLNSNQAAQAAGIKPIIGCDVYVARNGMAERKTQRDNMSSGAARRDTGRLSKLS